MRWVLVDGEAWQAQKWITIPCLASCLCVVLATSPALSAQVKADARLVARIGAGALVPATSLGRFNSAEARLGTSPVITGGLEFRVGSIPFGARVGGTFGLIPRINVSPATNCHGSCTPLTVSLGRFVAAGMDFVVRPAHSRLSATLGPWVRSYRSVNTFSACDLDEYCANSTYFHPTDTHLAVRLGLSALLGGKDLPVSVEAADYVSSYRNGKTQHNVEVGVRLSVLL